MKDDEVCDEAMEWRDNGIVIGVRAFGESSRIVELLTGAHGRSLGLVRGARSSRMRVVLQPGNAVAASWRARLDDQLGTFALELETAHAGPLMETAHATFALQSMAALLRLLPERDPHPRLYDALAAILPHLSDPMLAGEAVVRFELLLLDEFGFGLDLSACAATGSTEDLAYVSPKSGRAVSRSAAAPYATRLLALPPFLRADRQPEPVSSDEIAAGLRLTGYFLETRVADQAGRPLPDIRRHMVDAITRALP